MKLASLLLFLLPVVLLLFSCADGGGSDEDLAELSIDDDDDAGSGPGQATDDDDDNDDSAECPDAIWEYLRVDSMAAPPPNPITGDETPDELNYVSFFRYRADTGDAPPAPAKAILMVIPGFTVGAGYLTYLAEKLVKQSCGAIEVWALERRFHNLEDMTGMQEAERQRDPDIAYGYYYEGKEVNGRTFDGFLSAYNEETGMLSEWGMEVMLNDIRSVIHLVPEPYRRTNVFLGGHSRGAAHIKAYAAWEFDDGVMGCDEIAGLVMLDGESRYLPITENMYLASLDLTRRGILPRNIILPPLGVRFYTYIEILSMAASREFMQAGNNRLGPQGFYGNFGPFEYLLPLLYRFQDLKLTNEAFMGFFFDSDSGPVSLLHGGVGALDGPTGEDFLGLYPNDPSHLYHWKDYDEVDPEEFSDLQEILKSFYRGPSNTTDPYYTTRLDLDYYAANLMDVAGTWRETYFPLYASRMDAPVYLIGTSVLSETDRWELYRAILPPVRGQDLPRDEYGFHVLMIPEWEHLDSAYAAVDRNPLIPDLLAWMDEFAEGTVQIP